MSGVCADVWSGEGLIPGPPLASGASPARPLHDGVIEAVSISGRGDYGVRAWVNLPSVGGGSALYPVELAYVPPLWSDLVVHEPGMAWARCQGWDVDGAVARWHSMSAEGVHRDRAVEYDRLASSSDQADREHAEWVSDAWDIVAATVDDLGDVVAGAAARAAEAAKRKAREAVSGAVKAVLVSAGVGVALRWAWSAVSK